MVFALHWFLVFGELTEGALNHIAIWISELRGLHGAVALVDLGEHYAFLVVAVDVLISVLYRLILVLNHVRKDISGVYLRDLNFGSYFFCIFVYCWCYVYGTIQVQGVSLPLFDLEVTVLKVFIRRLEGLDGWIWFRLKLLYYLEGFWVVLEMFEHLNLR